MTGVSWTQTQKCPIPKLSPSTPQGPWGPPTVGEGGTGTAALLPQGFSKPHRRKTLALERQSKATDKAVEQHKERKGKEEDGRTEGEIKGGAHGDAGQYSRCD